MRVGLFQLPAITGHNGFGFVEQSLLFLVAFLPAVGSASDAITHRNYHASAPRPARGWKHLLQSGTHYY